MLKTLLLTVMLVSSTAFSATVEFRQDGWGDGGGPLLVSFEGVDVDHDGGFVVGELTEFQAMWRTPEGTLTEWGLTEIESDGFLFSDLGNFLFFIRNPEYSMVNTAFEGEALATVFDSFLFPVSSTATPAEAVPEPATAALVCAALSVILGGVTRIRTQKEKAGEPCRTVDWRDSHRP